MKKILILLFSFVIFLSACSKDEEYDMSIKPSEFSQETLKVLEILDDELQFFDINLNETAKSYSMSIWVYRDGEWQEDGKTYGNIDMLESQIAINLSKTKYELFSINENGHTSSSYIIDSDFENSIGTTSKRLDSEIIIEIDKEIPLWVKIGTESNSMSILPLTEDFRDNECNEGVAITLTVFDEEID